MWRSTTLAMTEPIREYYLVGRRVRRVRVADGDWLAYLPDRRACVGASAWIARFAAGLISACDVCYDCPALVCSARALMPRSMRRAIGKSPNSSKA